MSTHYGRSWELGQGGAGIKRKKVNEVEGREGTTDSEGLDSDGRHWRTKQVTLFGVYILKRTLGVPWRHCLGPVLSQLSNTLQPVGRVSEHGHYIVLLQGVLCVFLAWL